MPICLPKQESIRSSTIGLYSLLKQARSESRLTDQEYALALVYLRKIEHCAYIYSSPSSSNRSKFECGEEEGS